MTQFFLNKNVSSIILCLAVLVVVSVVEIRQLHLYFSLIHCCIVDTIYFDVGTKNPKIIVDDHDFNMARKAESKTTWICSGYFKTKCKARATTSGRMVYVNGIHNHLPKQKRSRFTNMLSQNVTIVRNASISS